MLDATVWISLLTYLGFAGTLGVLLRQGISLAGFLFLGLVFLPVTLGLPDLGWMRWAGWILALLVAAIFFKRPYRLPAWLWSRSFALIYFGSLMFFIAGWGFVSGHLGVGIASSVAALMATYRLGEKPQS